jgi:hypothetical protein
VDGVNGRWDAGVACKAAAETAVSSSGPLQLQLRDDEEAAADGRSAYALLLSQPEPAATAAGTEAETAAWRAALPAAGAAAEGAL